MIFNEKDCCMNKIRVRRSLGVVGVMSLLLVSMFFQAQGSSNFDKEKLLYEQNSNTKKLSPIEYVAKMISLKDQLEKILPHCVTEQEMQKDQDYVRSLQSQSLNIQENNDIVAAIKFRKKLVTTMHHMNGKYHIGTWANGELHKLMTEFKELQNMKPNDWA